MHAYLGHDDRRPAPLILGHEARAVVGRPATATRVTINPLVTCGTCRPAGRARQPLPARQIISMPPREGAFAQYVAMPERNLVDGARRRRLEKAALAEPIACQLARRAAGAGARMTRLRRERAGDRRRRHRPRGGAGAARRMGATTMSRWSSPTPPPRYLVRDGGRFPRLRPRGGDGPARAMPRLVVDARRLCATRAAASARGPSGRRDRAYRAGRRVRRARHPPHDAAGDHLHRHLHLHRAGFPRHRAAMFDGRLGPLDWTETARCPRARAPSPTSARAASPRPRSF
jgi:L-gulonate 5-dehydrogenase